jgi:hypothetical protein
MSKMGDHFIEVNRELEENQMPFSDDIQAKLLIFAKELNYLYKKEQCMDEASIQRADAFERASRIVLNYAYTTTD